MRLELIEGKLSRSVPRGLGGSNPTWLLGTGRKGSKDLARGLPYLRSRFRARLRPGVIRTDRARGVGDRTLVADDPWARGEMS